MDAALWCTSILQAPITKDAVVFTTNASPPLTALGFNTASKSSNCFFALQQKYDCQTQQYPTLLQLSFTLDKFFHAILLILPPISKKFWTSNWPLMPCSPCCCQHHMTAPALPADLPIQHSPWFPENSLHYSCFSWLHHWHNNNIGQSPLACDSEHYCCTLQAQHRPTYLLPPMADNFPDPNQKHCSIHQLIIHIFSF